VEVITALIHYDWFPYQNGTFRHRYVHTGRRPCEDEGRTQGDASISHGLPKIASEPPEARGQSWDISSLTALRRSQLCRYLDLISDLQNCGRYPVCGTLVWQP